MKSVLFRTLVGFLLLTLSCMARAGWHDETQATRNQQIVNQANHDLSLVGGACKVWANDVVRVSSYLAGGPDTPIYLPPATNGGNGYAWDLSKTIDQNHVLSYGAYAANAMRPGMLIQMRIRYKDGTYGPHTSIVFSNSVATQQIVLIESNYNGDYVVKKRTVPYSWFGLPYIESGNHYSVYEMR